MSTTTIRPPEVTPAASPVRLVREPQAGFRRQAGRFALSLAPQSWASLDALLVAVASIIGYSLLRYVHTGYQWIANPWLMTATFCICVTIGGLVFGLYERRTLLERSRILLRSLLSLGLGCTLAYACLSLYFYAQASRWVGLVVCLAYLAVAVPLRLYAHGVITSSKVRLLCVGAGESIRKLVRVLLRKHDLHYEIIGHLRVDERAHDGVSRGPFAPPRFWSVEDLELDESCPYLGSLECVHDVLAEQGIDEVVVASELTANPDVGAAVSACLEARCRVTDQATFIEKLLGEVPAESIATDWFLNADIQNRASYDTLKRLIDVAIAAVGLALALPLWPLLALAVRLDSRGPAIFRQIRVGQYGRLFTIYKFRTMRQDAERDGARWAERNDGRVTRIGRFLRQSRLDELPQLVNILRGDMSIIGPRPERPEFVHNLEQLIPHYRLRHLIKPGLTGWAQIHYHYGGSIGDAHRKLCFDLYYLKHRSADVDIAILIRTLGTFVLGAR